MEKDLAEGIKRVAEALNKHDVEYMFVGGVAISFYGNPRPSSNLPKGVEYDIDVWYQASKFRFPTRTCRVLSQGFQKVFYK